MSYFRRSHRSVHLLMWNRSLMGHGKKILTVAENLACGIGTLTENVPFGFYWKGGTRQQSKMENQPHKNTCIHKYVAFKPCHLRARHSLSYLPRVGMNLNECLDLCLHDHIWHRINKPRLNEGHIVIRQHWYCERHYRQSLKSPMSYGDVWVGRERKGLLMLKWQDRSTVTSLWRGQGCEVQLPVDDTFMLKSESGCIPPAVLIEGGWQGAPTANKISW